ncbi:glycosyl hydrolase family 61-domain-containing protein [Roridomyces roridus]|uniref:lytic cellulose monooxygenase (C4-dehydrogenating) n=1 Tax=Roridomyces roridus TaxID=1738132 RepID=A0AAD7G2X4_9AGAR|nr:glycosyl hydrolase family 61-domain-containing protein [Roridomyces roridus]
MFFGTILLLPFLYAPYVSAHGFVHKVWIGTETFIGNTPNADPTSSIVRQINNVDPVKGAGNPYLNCGQNAQFASNITEANPGDSMSFLWTGGDLSRWPHNIGPMLWYMTSCGDTDCTTFNSTNAEWFKVAQVGRIPGDTDGTWYQDRIYETDGVASNMTLPTNILPGAYLLRHEIIALHLANEMGGAEFYPSCTQIRIAGSGTGQPSANEVVQFPGGYSDSDPGIYVPDVFDTPPPPYSFPGPPIAAFVGSAAAPGSSPGSSSMATGSSRTPSTPTVSAPSAPSSSSSTTSNTRTCQLKRTSLARVSKRHANDVRTSGPLGRIIHRLSAFSFGGRSVIA